MTTINVKHVPGYLFIENNTRDIYLYENYGFLVTSFVPDVFIAILTSHWSRVSNTMLSSCHVTVYIPH